MVAHVSERRLRTAFTDTVNLPPIRYFPVSAAEPGPADASSTPAGAE